MEMDALLNMVFAAVISGLGWWIKSQHDEIKRVTILLNRTREEMAKDEQDRINLKKEQALLRLRLEKEAIRLEAEELEKMQKEK